MVFLLAGVVVSAGMLQGNVSARQFEVPYRPRIAVRNMIGPWHL